MVHHGILRPPRLAREIGLSNTYDPDIFQTISRTSSIAPPTCKTVGTTPQDTTWRLLSLLSPTLDAKRLQTRSKRTRVSTPFWSLTGNPNLLSSVEVQDLAIEKGWTPQQQLSMRFWQRG